MPITTTPQPNRSKSLRERFMGSAPVPQPANARGSLYQQLLSQRNQLRDGIQENRAAMAGDRQRFAAFRAGAPSVHEANLDDETEPGPRSSIRQRLLGRNRQQFAKRMPFQKYMGQPKKEIAGPAGSSIRQRLLGSSESAGDSASDVASPMARYTGRHTVNNLQTANRGYPAGAGAPTTLPGQVAPNSPLARYLTKRADELPEVGAPLAGVPLSQRQVAPTSPLARYTTQFAQAPEVEAPLAGVPLTLRQQHLMSRPGMAQHEQDTGQLITGMDAATRAKYVPGTIRPSGTAVYEGQQTGGPRLVGTGESRGVDPKTLAVAKRSRSMREKLMGGAQGKALRQAHAAQKAGNGPLYDYARRQLAEQNSQPEQPTRGPLEVQPIQKVDDFAAHFMPGEPMAAEEIATRAGTLIEAGVLSEDQLPSLYKYLLTAGITSKDEVESETARQGIGGYGNLLTPLIRNYLFGTPFEAPGLFEDDASHQERMDKMNRLRRMRGLGPIGT